MRIQYKTVGVSQTADNGDGRITAYVSVTGLVDNVKDIIHPGAYDETLERRRPKGVWSHDWNQPIARTLSAQELKPGHPDLPKTLANGQPWPENAGALKVDMEFNTVSPRGMQAYQDVKFFGPEQEWSIGYRVPEGGAKTDEKTGIRHIHRLDLFEYSPVLFGAMGECRTAPGKSEIATAQLQFKSLHGASTEVIDGFWARLNEFKSAAGLDIEFKDEGVDSADDFEADDAEDTDYDDIEIDEDDDDDEDADPDDDSDDEDEDDDDEEDEEDEDDEDEDDEHKSLDPQMLRDGIKALQTVLTAMGEDVFEPDNKMYELGGEVFIEAKSMDYTSVVDAVDAIDAPMDSADASSLRSSAQAFDDAIQAGDADAAESAAEDILEAIESMSDAEGDNNGGDVDSIRAVARLVADKLSEVLDQQGDQDDEEDQSDNGDDEDEEDEYQGKTYVDNNGVEFKNFSTSTRRFGVPKDVAGNVKLEGKDRRRAFIGALGDEELVALSVYLDDVNGNAGMKSDVSSEMDIRSMVDPEFKRVVRTAEGARKYGVPIGSVIGGHGKAKPAGHTMGGRKNGGHLHGGLQRADRSSRKAKVRGMTNEELMLAHKYHVEKSKANPRLGKGRSLEDDAHQHVGQLLSRELSQRKAKGTYSAVRYGGEPDKHTGRGGHSTARIYSDVKHMAQQGQSAARKKMASLTDEQLQAIHEHHHSEGKKKVTATDRYSLHGKIARSTHKTISAALQHEKRRRANGSKGDFTDNIEYKDNPYNADDMAKLGKKGQAFKNSAGQYSYPTPNLDFLDKAATAWGRAAAADRDGLKSYLKKRAKELKAPQDLVDRINNLGGGDNSGSKSSGVVIDTKSLESFAELLKN